MTSRVAEGALDPADLLRETEDPASGALVVVSGGRGGSAPEGDAAGEEALDRALGAIEDEAPERFEVRRCRLRARPAAPAGDRAVLAVVRARHRAAAFEAARWAVSSALERLPGRGGP